MAEGYDTYGIDFSDYDNIKRIIKNTILPAPFRALKGWNKKMDSSVIRRVEALNENTNDLPKKKIWGMF
jgi:NADH:ubiquinone oxidoreductase subunit C